MTRHGLFRVAAACPEVRVADCRFNAGQILELVRNASKNNVDLIVFPELGITGYSCGDLFHQHVLLQSAKDCLLHIITETQKWYAGLCAVGIPLVHDGKLFNCAVLFYNGKMLGVVPKSYLPNYNEFYEARQFTPSASSCSGHIDINGESVPFGTDLIFQATNIDGLIIGIEICEDLWMPVAPSSYQSIAGATVLVNLSASNEILGKSDYRRQLVLSQSGRCIAGYVYSSCGISESSTDIVFGGHCIIAENGISLAESERFQYGSRLTIADIDLDHLQHDRLQQTTFGESCRNLASVKVFRRIPFIMKQSAISSDELHFRPITAHPFVPSNPVSIRERCQEVFRIQVAGLAKRLQHIELTSVSIGVSGGLDSTLALIVACKAFDILGLDRAGIRALSMPGFGTTARTKNNAALLMSELGVSCSEIDIRKLALDLMHAQNHAPFGITLDHLDVEQLSRQLCQLADDSRSDLVFENVQARLRTNLLMNTGFVIGTGDLSELALGWCTYNADHMSMYNPNSSIPKTLVKSLVQWVAESEFSGKVREALLDILETEISPELLPLANGCDPQSTESTIGPYELHDFFLYHFLRWGSPPNKIVFLAQHAKFNREYSVDDIRRWMRVFLTRFFASQYKRSCLPDGPKVGTVSLSPRGDWRMPSDAVVKMWLDSLDVECHAITE